MSNPTVVLGMVVLLAVSSMSIGFGATDAALADDESAVIGFTADVQSLETVVIGPIDPRDNRTGADNSTNMSGRPEGVPGPNPPAPGPTPAFGDVPPGAQNDSDKHNETGTNGTVNQIDNATDDRAGTGNLPENETIGDPESGPTLGIENDSTNLAEPQNGTGPIPTGPGPRNDDINEPDESSPEVDGDQSTGASESEDPETGSAENTSDGQEDPE
ncbi:MAG: hypothetical protein ACOCY6_04445, partial [Halodesulfurarchaeum sp.]